MHTELNVPVSFMGIVSMIISGGTIVSSLFSDKLTRRFGTRIVTVASVFFTVIALFYIGITAGRFISGFITDRLGDRRMILLGTGILVCGIIALFVPVESYKVAVVAFLVIGFGCAPIYPCIIHSTPYNFGAENSGAIIGIQMASAYVGSTFIPPLFGLIGNKVSFSVMPIYLFVFFALMVTMIETTFSITHKVTKD